MKQEDESGNFDAVEEDVMADTPPKKGITKSSGVPIVAPKDVSASGDKESVSGSTNNSDGEGSAGEPSGLDNAADSTSPELNKSANTSGSSLGGETSSSPCSQEVDRRPEMEMERSFNSYNDSVSESNPRDSLSSCSEISTPSGVTDKSGRNRESTDMCHSPSQPEAVSNCDGRQTETDDEPMSESNPRESLSSSSLSNTPSGVSDRSGRNSVSSDMDQSPTNPLSGTSLSEQNIALQNASSTRPSEVKMTLRSGKVTRDEGFPSKKMRDTSKKVRQQSLGGPTKRRLSVDEQSHSPSEVIPEKLPRLVSSDTCSSETEGSMGALTLKSEDITNVSSSPQRENTTNTNAEDSPSENERIMPDAVALNIKSEEITNISSSPQRENPTNTNVENSPSEKELLMLHTGSVIIKCEEITDVSSLPQRENTTNTNVEDSPPENERLMIENADDAPVHKASNTTSAEEEEAVIGNEKSVNEKLPTASSEVAPDNDLYADVKEAFLEQTSGKKTANSNPSTNQPADNDVVFSSISVTDGTWYLLKVLKRATSVPSASGSDVSMDDANETQPSGAEDQDTCKGSQECSEEAVTNASQEPSVQTPLDSNLSAGDRLTAQYVLASTGENDAEVDVENECLEAISPCPLCAEDSAATPDSSTADTAEENTSNRATNVKQEMPTNTSHSSETNVTTEKPINCGSLDHNGLSGCLEKIFNDLPHENSDTTSSNKQDTEDETTGKLPQHAGEVESPEENETLSLEQQYHQRDLQIYRYLRTSDGPDVRFSPYVTRRRPLRSENSTRWGIGTLRAAFGNADTHYRREVSFRRPPRQEARQTDDGDHQDTSGTVNSVGDTCSIS